MALMTHFFSPLQVIFDSDPAPGVAGASSSENPQQNEKMSQVRIGIAS